MADPYAWLLLLKAGGLFRLLFRMIYELRKGRPREGARKEAHLTSREYPSSSLSEAVQP